MSELKECSKACERLDTSCPNTDCRSWVDYEDDLNCVHITIKKHGNMTLREVSKRIGCSFVRIKQIEEEALQKIKDKTVLNDYL